MSPEFAAKVLQGYQNDTYWTCILEMLDCNERQDEDAAILPFVRGRNFRATDADLHFGLRLGAPLQQPEMPEQDVTQPEAVE